MGGYSTPASGGMYPPPPQGPPQWNNYNPPAAQSSAQQPGNVPTPAAFFPHQIGQGIGGPRFPAERPGTQSRQALSNMLRQRHPGAQQHPGGQYVPGQAASVTPTGPGSTLVGAGAAPPGGPGGMIGNARAGGGGVVGGQQPPFSGMPMAVCDLIKSLCYSSINLVCLLCLSPQWCAG